MFHLLARALPVEEFKRWSIARNDDGRVHLVDLKPIEMEPEPQFNALNDVRFLLFTRNNPTSAQILNMHDLNTVRNSNWDPLRSVRFIIHGWQSNASTAMNAFITRDLLARADHNVVGEFCFFSTDENIYF
jgi:hypothetical protein